jgi:hypothetical protein
MHTNLFMRCAEFDRCWLVVRLIFDDGISRKIEKKLMKGDVWVSKPVSRCVTRKLERRVIRYLFQKCFELLILVSCDRRHCGRTRLALGLGCANIKGISTYAISCVSPTAPYPTPPPTVACAIILRDRRTIIHLARVEPASRFVYC